MLKIYVDGDSCPVKEEILRLSMRHCLDVYLVSNRWSTQVMGPRVHKILVSSGADVADDWIVNNIGKNDIAITADILLAQRCINLGAYVIGPQGKAFTEDNIGIIVAMRNLNTHLRETGEISGNNKSITKQDKSRFLQELELAIQKIKSEQNK
ncbi:MAG: YaiI/YqxD family protein [Rickettsiales bacterium]